MDNQGNTGDSSWVTTFVFIAGVLLGAGAALLMTPEAGPSLRGRLAKGAKIAQDELSDMATDTKEAMNSWSQEAQHALKQAKTRVSAAVDATKQAVKTSPNDKPATKPER